MIIENSAFVFESALAEGIIRKRRNRFIMEVEVNGAMCDCHCPSTGSIGNIIFRDIPCLLSKSKDTTRKTLYTVEALSVDLPYEKEKAWIGINQNAANRYVEHYLKTGQLCDMVANNNSVKREQKLGISKLDFLVSDTYIEVKTPLQTLQVEKKEHIKEKKSVEFSSFDRFVKHINELAGSLKQNERAILLICFIYDNPRFMPARNSKHSNSIRNEVSTCIKRGIEIWQINFKITPTEVSLEKYFEITNDFVDI